MHVLPTLPMAKYIVDDVDAPVPTLNSSLAHLLLTRSAAHVYHQHPKLNPVWAQDDHARFDLGTAAHAVILEHREDLLGVVEADDWRKNEAKAAREIFRQAGKIPVLAAQAADVRAMNASVKQALTASPDLVGLGELVPEQTLVWDQKPSVWLRCRPDWLTADRRGILSLKTTWNGEPDTYLRTSLLSNGNDMQMAFEMVAVMQLTGSYPHYVWVTVETEPPYAVSLLGPSPDLIDYAMHRFRAAVEQWEHCLTVGVWPSYPSRICYLEPPAWARLQWESRNILPLA